MNTTFRSNRKASPCRGCPDRFPACSDHCRKPEYLAYREEQARIKAAKEAYRPPAWTWPEGSRKGFGKNRSDL